MTFPSWKMMACPKHTEGHCSHDPFQKSIRGQSACMKSSAQKASDTDGH